MRTGKPIHPGEFLRTDVLPVLKMSASELARNLGVSRQMLHAVLAEHNGISPEMALRLGTLLNNDPQFWLSLQMEFDLWMAEKKLHDVLKGMVRIKTPSNTLT